MLFGMGDKDRDLVDTRTELCVCGISFVGCWLCWWDVVVGCLLVCEDLVVFQWDKDGV